MDTIAVNIWGRRLGALTWDDRRQLGRFAYDPAFIKTGLEVAPLTMPLSGKIYEFPTLVRTRSFMGLPGLIADCLPEKFGNAVLAAKLGQLGRQLDEVTPVERLCYLGTRGMGALEFEPDWDTRPNGSATPLVVEELVAMAEQILKQRSDMTTRLESGNLDTLIQIGTSAGGAKAKAIIAWNEETNQVVSGAGDIPVGYSHWLMKFDAIDNEELATSRHIGQIEYAYHLMAVLAGIDMMECRLFEDGNRSHFMTRRFDRPNSGGKIHCLTFCGMAHADRDPPGMQGYEQLFSTARKLGLGQTALDEIFRRMCFNILARNQDDHSKNHAFSMDQSGTWGLTPAYDLCFAYKPGNPYIESHQMSCNGKRTDFQRSDLLAAAKAGDINKPDQILEEVQEALLAWPAIAQDLGLEQIQIKAIQNLFRHF